MKAMFEKMSEQFEAQVERQISAQLGSFQQKLLARSSSVHVKSESEGSELQPEQKYEQYQHEIRNAIKPQQSHQAIKSALSSVPTLDRTKNNGNKFIRRFKDYLKSKGLLEAVNKLGVTHMDLTRNSEQDVTYNIMLRSLREDDNQKHLEAWGEANTALRSKLSDDYYYDLVGDENDSDFFSLWQDVLVELGKNETNAEASDMMEEISTLVMGPNESLVAFIKVIDDLTNKTNRVTCKAIYGDEMKQQILIKGVDKHHLDRFKDAINKVKTATKQMSWEVVKQTFVTLDSQRKRIGLRRSEETTEPAMALQAQRGRPNGNTCRYCKLEGHTIADCPTRPPKSPDSICFAFKKYGVCNFEKRTGRKCSYLHEKPNVSQANLVSTLQDQINQQRQQIQHLTKLLTEQKNAQAQAQMATSAASNPDDDVDIEQELLKLGFAQMAKATSKVKGILHYKVRRRATIFDTGATNMATDNDSNLKDLRPSGMTMQSANGGYSDASLKGSFPPFKGITLNDVLLVKDFKDKTLISWPVLDKLGFSFDGKDGKINIYKPNGELWQTATRATDDLFHLEEMEQHE